MRLFPDFDDNLRQAFRQETELFFDSILREDRSVLDLLRADYTFVNERLAKHYGIPHVYGSHFRRIALDEDSERGGLLRQGSILTVTSYATRTSPVLRGKWILDNLLGVPPPPPLPDVPTLKDNTVDGSLTVRKRLAEHRSNAVCAACHNLMDPIGLSLEKFDAVGRRRTVEDGVPIDASGGLPDGSRFVDVDGLEAALLRRPELFVGAFTEKLLTYASGRGVEYYDAPAIRTIVRGRTGAGFPHLLDRPRSRQEPAVSDEDVTMIITRMALPRRTFLRGLGASVALPLLDAMIPSMTALAKTAADPVRRLGFVYMPMGCDLPRWTPPGEGRLTELSPSLQSLAPVVDQLTVISNLELKNAYPGTHATSNASFLSAAKAKWTESTDYHLGTTVDQVAAKQLGQQTLLPSLELSMDLLQMVGQCDNGYACVYQNNLSWSSPTTPLPAEAHPRIVFERLFGEGGSAADRRAALQRRASLLDSVRDDITRLQTKLGPEDRARVGQYLETVREVERRIQKAEAGTADQPLPDLDRPVGVPAAYADHAKLMFDLQVLAHAGRCHAGHDLPARARDEQPDLHRDRRARSASPAHAPWQRSGQDREDGEDQRLPRLAVRLLPREAEGDAGRRRVAARSRALPLRQRHGQSQRARSRQPADPRRRRRRGQAQGRSSHPVRGTDAAGEPAPDAARACWCPSGRVRRQPGQSRRTALPLTDHDHFATHRERRCSTLSVSRSFDELSGAALRQAQGRPSCLGSGFSFRETSDKFQ